MGELTLDLRPKVADLRSVSIAELPELRGDTALEATLRRLRREAEGKTDTVVSAFASAI